MDENKHKCSSCTLYSIIFSILFTINARTGSYFLYFHWCLKETLLVFNLLLVLKQRFNELINGRRQANRDQKSNLLFLQRHVQSQKFRLKIAKNRQKALERD